MGQTLQSHEHLHFKYHNDTLGEVLVAKHIPIKIGIKLEKMLLKSEKMIAFHTLTWLQFCPSLQIHNN